jgi:hypothetical protein
MMGIAEKEKRKLGEMLNGKPLLLDLHNFVYRSKIERHQ